MANKDLLKQAIAEAKSVREAAIANAKEALEETLTPHLKDMLAAKLQEMEDASVEEEVVNEVEEEVEEALEENTSGFEAVTAEAEEDEAEDESEESEDEAGHEAEESEEEEAAEEEEVEGDEDLGDLTVDQFKDMIRDIIAQELGQGGEEELGADMDGGDIEGMGDEEAIEEPAELDAAADEEEIDLDELLRELESVSEEKEEEMEEGKKEEMEEETIEEEVEEEVNEADAVKAELEEALETIETLRKDLQEVNLLNSKLLYVNKIFKANNLTESQKVNIIAAFDKAETVKEVKLVFETVSESVTTAGKKENVTEAKLGMASKATGTTATKPEIISENTAVHRMQVLAGIKPRQY